LDAGKGERIFLGNSSLPVTPGCSSTPSTAVGPEGPPLAADVQSQDANKGLKLIEAVQAYIEAHKEAHPRDIEAVKCLLRMSASEQSVLDSASERPVSTSKAAALQDEHDYDRVPFLFTGDIRVPTPPVVSEHSKRCSAAPFWRALDADDFESDIAEINFLPDLLAAMSTSKSLQAEDPIKCEPTPRKHWQDGQERAPVAHDAECTNLSILSAMD
jgi:hypothetical protein